MGHILLLISIMVWNLVDLGLTPQTIGNSLEPNPRHAIHQLQAVNGKIDQEEHDDKDGIDGIGVYTHGPSEYPNACAALGDSEGVSTQSRVKISPFPRI